MGLSDTAIIRLYSSTPHIYQADRERIIFPDEFIDKIAAIYKKIQLSKNNPLVPSPTEYAATFRRKYLADAEEILTELKMSLEAVCLQKYRQKCPAIYGLIERETFFNIAKAGYHWDVKRKLFVGLTHEEYIVAKQLILEKLVESAIPIPKKRIITTIVANLKKPIIKKS